MLLLWPGLVMYLGMANALFDPIIETENGIIRGRVEEFSKKNLRQSGSVEVYLGIPYGKPPIGERRFRPAEPVEPWTEDLNATRTPPSCPQNIPAFYEHLIDDAAGFSEDCLYLNVFVPHNIVSIYTLFTIYKYIFAYICIYIYICVVQSPNQVLT